MEKFQSGSLVSKIPSPSQGSLQHIRDRQNELGRRGCLLGIAPIPNWTDTKKVVRFQTSKAMTSETPIGQPDDFVSALLDYSKAVIKSGMDCEDEQAQSLEANIINTREKVIATHEAAVSQLESSTSNWRKEKRQLEETITTLKQEKKGFEGELRGMRTAEAEIKERSAKDKKEVQKYKALWEKELEDNKKLEDETAQLKNESRKRRRVEEIWERAEKVKMD